jgi:hypothetical protein
MACDDATAASTALASAIAGPAKVQGDAGMVESHKLSDLIEADKYQSAKCAGSSPRRGLRITRLIPPGAI